MCPLRPDSGPHFLVTTAAEAATGAQAVQLDEIDGFAAWDDGTHGFGPEDLASLHCLVLGRARDWSVLDSYQIVFVQDDMHGPWLIRIPDEFVKALASLRTDQVESIGEQWLEASSGFRFRQAPKDWVQHLGNRLAELARRAVSQGKGMYWESPSC